MTGGGHSSSKEDLAIGTGASTDHPADSFDALLKAAVSPSEGSEAASAQRGRFERLALGTRIADQFVVEWHAGAGGMGDVYRCQDVERGGTVALKVIRNVGDQARFRREVLILSAVSHEAIVRYVAHGSTDSGTPYLAMEWLEGEDLGKRLKRNRLAVRDSVNLARRVCGALAHAHGNGFIHRDLKPSNVFLCAGRVEEAKLLDFGVAHRGVATQTATRAGTLLGTVGYMAPEQASGIRLPDARDDLFSLGCVLFECLTGRPAFLGDSSVAVLESVLHAEPPAPHVLQPAVPLELSVLVHQLLRKNRQDRPSNAGVVLEQLDALAKADPDANALLTTSTVWRAVPPRFVARLAAEPLEPAASEQTAATTRRFGAIAASTRAGTMLLELEDRPLVDLAESAVQCALALLDAQPTLRMSLTTSAPALPLGSPGAVSTDGATLALYRCRAESEVAPLPARLHCVFAAHGVSLPLVGRDAELATLEAVFEECANDEVARSLLASAPSGIGKSRLAREFMSRRAVDGRSRVLALRMDPSAADQPWKLVTSLAAQIQPIASVDEARHVLAAQYERASSAAPLVFCIDDAHCADLASMEFVASLLADQPERSVLLIAFTRPQPSAELHAVWQGMAAHTLHLRPLSLRASERFLRAQFPAQVHDQLALAVALAEGNPRLLTALVQAAAGHGGWFEAAVLLFAERLTRLASAELSVLCAASVFGSLFLPSGIGAVLKTSVGIERELAALCERKLIGPRPQSRLASELEYEILHPVVAEAAWRILREIDRVQARSRASAWLAQLALDCDELAEAVVLR